MNLIKRKSEGHLLLWEDDILVPAHAFERLFGVLEESSEHVAVTGVQYRRNYRNPHQLLLWKFFPWRKLIGSHPDQIEHVKIVNYLNTEERSEGVSIVDAAATGFVLFRDSFLRNYTFREAVFFDGFCAGHDIMVGFDINNLDQGFVPARNKMILCWDLKFPHLGTDDRGGLKVFRSDLCPTLENL